MDEKVQFIKWLKGTSEVEINNLSSILDFKSAQGKKNIYFVCGLETKTGKRCADDDIKTKRYFVVDIDIRLEYYNKHGVVLDQSQLRDEIANILIALKDTEFDDYCTVVDSGNGAHLYYSGKERQFEKEIYSQGVSYIYEQIDSKIGKLGYRCDPVCNNLARIMRLPGTMNPRKKEQKKEMLWDLGLKECEILFFEEKNCGIFDKIEEYAGIYKQELEKEKGDRKKVNEIVRKDYKKSDIWERINEIPACDIACEIRGVSLVDKGLDNVALKEQHKNMGAYWYKPHNVIVNTGSSLIKTDKSYFTSYELVYYELMDKDKQKTVEYFKQRYGIETEEKGVKIPKKKEYKKQGYIYGNDTFNEFDCVMSGELVTIVARSNVGKTTFAMDMIQANSKIGKKCFYINLEYDIKTVREGRWLFINNKKKRNLTDLDPLTSDEEQKKDMYVQKKLQQFDYYNDPKGMCLEDIVELIKKKHSNGYGLFVVDTFSRITGNLDSKISHTNQNKTMETLQELCQNIGVVVILLHHTNKKGDFEGSQKIMDLSNVFINMIPDYDMYNNRTTRFELTKDKFITKIEIDTFYRQGEYLPA